MAEIPRIPIFSLTGIEAKIQTLQTVLGNELSWLQYSFGKCERHEKIEKGEKVVWPVCFVANKSDPIDMRPNDNYESYAFWDVIDPGRTDYPGQERSVRKYTMWEYDVALIIWANLKRIDDSAYIETKAQFREDILNVFEVNLIGQNIIFVPGEIFDRDIEQIFAGFDLTQEWNINKWPFVGFRLNGIIRFNRKCPISNIYSIISFKTTWQTENAGSDTKTIVIPTTGSGYDCMIDWGDGSSEAAAGTPGNITHVYATTGIKTVKITGTFPRIYFNNGGDKLKLLTIEKWGKGAWASMEGAFYGCANLIGNYTDVPNISSVTNMANMLRGCLVFNSPLSMWGIAAVTDMANFMNGANAWSTANYSAALIAWNALGLTNGVTAHFGDATYNAGAAAAKANMIAGGGHNWTISDGGAA